MEKEARKINKAGLELIKSFEGCFLKSYLCPANVLTIGYGHTGKEVKENQTITFEQAEKFLSEDLEKFCKTVEKCLLQKVKDNQFSALVCLCFNIGESSFKNSTLLKELNWGNSVNASNEFLRWNKIKGIESKGLLNRRIRERELFMTKDKK